MRGLVAAWVVGEAIIVWRLAHRDHRMPVPGELLGVTVLFAGLAAAAEVFPAAAGVITLGAWGLDVAGFLNVLPKGLGGEISQAESAQQGGPREGAVANG